MKMLTDNISLCYCDVINLLFSDKAVRVGTQRGRFVVATGHELSTDVAGEALKTQNWTMTRTRNSGNGK